MNQKSSYAFRLVLGGWLTYLGVSLLYQMYKERPSNMVLISVIAVIFVVVGAVCAIHSLLKILGIRMPKLFRNFKKKKADKAEEPEVQQFIPTDSNVQPVALTAPEEISPAENLKMLQMLRKMKQIIQLMLQTGRQTMRMLRKAMLLSQMLRRILKRVIQVSRRTMRMFRKMLRISWRRERITRKPMRLKRMPLQKRLKLKNRKNWEQALRMLRFLRLLKKRKMTMQTSLKMIMRRNRYADRNGL